MIDKLISLFLSDNITTTSLISKILIYLSNWSIINICINQRGDLQMQLKEKYITDQQGNRIGVLLDIEEYQQLLEQLEELEAIQAYDNAILLDEEEIPFEVAISEIENSRQ